MLRLPICAIGICVSYLYFGYFQERLFSNPEERLGASFVLVTSCITNTLVALVWRVLQEKVMEDKDDSLLLNNDTNNNDTNNTNKRNSTIEKPIVLNHPLLVGTAFCYVAAMTASNEAIPMVSYPVAVLAKSCKLIPIMFVGQFIERKLYSWTEWMAAFFISSGIVLFHFSRMATHNKTDQSTNHDQPIDDKDENYRTTFGMGLLLISLILDGLLSSCQNLLKRTKAAPHQPFVYRGPNAVETMLYVNLYALIFLIPWTIYNGQMKDGIERFGDTFTRLLIVNAAVGCGQIFIFLTVTWYSSIMTTTITTTRKFFTILLSVYSYGHVFTTIQWFAIVLVFCGLYLAILVQQRKRLRTADNEHKQQLKKLN